MSRFSEIYIPQPCINNATVNLYQYNNFLNEEKHGTCLGVDPNPAVYLKKHLVNLDTNIKIRDMADKLYDKGITGLDLMEHINATYKETTEKYKLLFVIQKIKRELRNEKIIILSILNFMLFRSGTDLENILCM